MFLGLVSVPNEFEEEMRGLAEASGGKLPYALVQRLNIGYDFVAKCTSSGNCNCEETMNALETIICVYRCLAPVFSLEKGMLNASPHLPGVCVNGEMYHLRNMDWEMPVLKKVTILTQFFKSGRMVHQGITWVGFVGTYTQLSNKGYSISLNCELAVGIVTDIWG